MTVARWILLLLALAVAGISEAHSASLGSPCWGVPDGARPVGKPQERRFEVKDELPGPPSAHAGRPGRAGSGSGTHLIPPDQPFSGIVWIPLAEPAEADAFIRRAIPYDQSVRTPAGVFTITVAQVRAVRAGTRDDGLLVCLDLDPAGRGEATYPLSDVFHAARAQGLLSSSQQRTLGELDRVVAGRWRGLQQAWNEFTQAPYVLPARRRLFELLRGFHNPLPVISAEDLAPERFFSRSQRVRLRSAGHEISGRCSVWLGSDRATVRLEACPLPQLVTAWNHLARSRGGPFLQATANGRFEEVDALSLEVVGLSEPAARDLVLSTLGSLPGLAKTTTADSTP
jgi:hypothetical protein